MPNDPSNEAELIYTELAPDAQFPNLDIDLSGTEYDLPSQTGNPLYTSVPKLSLDELTDGGIDGDGTFDKIMASVREHLTREYEDNRITGEEYTKAYIELTTAALSTGLSFLVQRDQTFYANQLVLMQARAAEIQAVTAGAQLEEQKQAAMMRQFDALNSRATFALTKMRLASEDIGYTLTEKQVDVAEAQKLQVEAETTAINYRRQEILPEEKRRLVYETDNVLPANVAKTEYETQHLMVQQKENLVKDAAVKSYQLSNILVQQFKLLEEQTQVQRAQTLDTRVDGTTAIAGAVGKQKELYSEQISSYKKDARYKVGKMYLDAWITQKSLDEGLFAPDQLNNTNVNEVLANLRTDNLLGS